MTTTFDRPAVLEHYTRQALSGNAMSAHLATLRELAEQCDTAVEFGVKNGGSSAALLLGCRELVCSYDPAETRHACALEAAAGAKWIFRRESSLDAEPMACDLLFIDSLHRYEQTKAELARHGQWATRFIVFHDTMTFGAVGALGETGKHDPEALGIRPAIDEFMAAHRCWFIREHHVHSHGLLVLERGKSPR